MLPMAAEWVGIGSFVSRVSNSVLPGLERAQLCLQGFDAVQIDFQHLIQVSIACYAKRGVIVLILHDAVISHGTGIGSVRYRTDTDNVQASKGVCPCLKLLYFW